MRLLLKILLSVFLAFVLIVAGGSFYLARGLESGRNLAVNDIDLSKVSDGTYRGKYNAGRWSNELEVTVKENKIIQIKTIKDVAIPKEDWREELFNRVIEKQSTKVDIVSGATVTSKAYLKSIENALKE